MLNKIQIIGHVGRDPEPRRDEDHNADRPAEARADDAGEEIPF